MPPLPTDPFFWLLLLILALLQVADLVTTRIILDRGGHEQNPVAVILMEMLTVNGFLVAKGILVIAAGYYVGLQSLWALGGLTAFYGWIIHHNMKSI